jgi:predicted nucleic acid-binding protein
MTDLEQLFSARSGAEHRARRNQIELRYARVPMDQLTFDRAIEVQGLLAARGQHRGANIPDLVVAAAAERAGLTVLHYDADFDLIATVTDQLVEWVVPRGSVD